jgi:cell wall assembly regulator SMI1
MLETLRRLEDLLAGKRPQLLATFRPPANDDDLGAFERSCSVLLTPEHRQLYRWRDGQFNDAIPCLQNFMQLLSLSKALEWHMVLTSLLRSGEFENWCDWWHAKWIPLLEGPSGDLICVDYGGAFGGNPGQLIDFVHNDNDRSVIAPSLGAWLGSYCNMLELDLLDEGGCLATSDSFMWTREIPGYPIAAEARAIERNVKSE